MPSAGKRPDLSASPSVALNLSGTVPHHRYLAATLSRSHHLARAVLFGADIEICESDSAGCLKIAHRVSSYRFCNRVLWGLSRRVPMLRQAPRAGVIVSLVAERLLSLSLPLCDVFHGLMGVSLASVRQAKGFGAVTLVDTTTLHPVAFNRAIRVAADRVALSSSHCEHVMPATLVERLEREYEACSRIVVYSRAAARSFSGSSYAHKTVLVHPGVDHAFFRPAGERRRGRDPFRVCYVGRVEAAKNLDLLIQAWRRLAINGAELVLVGRVFPEITDILNRSGSSTIRLKGILSRDEIAKELRQSDLFVFPSTNEGMSLALLEAMSSGLPSIACLETGAEDCLSAGLEGILIAGGDVDALANALQWAYEHPAELLQMGHRARERVCQEFTLARYAERLTALYRQPL
jgi:glycosyltransferase involved in cell wall biosynthesis